MPEKDHDEEYVTADIVLMDINPLSIGIEDSHGFFRKILPRNGFIPSQKSVVVKISRAQPEVAIKIYQGERAYARDNAFMHEVVLNPNDYSEEIEITMTIDVNGIFHVRIYDPQTGANLEPVLPQTRIDEEEIRDLVEAGELNHDSDAEAIKLMPEKIHLPLSRATIKNIIMKQHIDGYWNLEDVIQATGITEEKMRQGVALTKDDKSWATGYVLWQIEKSGMEEYSLIAQKASPHTDKEIIKYFRSTDFSYY